jgi:hypothetical protein
MTLECMMISNDRNEFSKIASINKYLRRGHNSHQKINLVSKHMLDTSWPAIVRDTDVVRGKMVHKHT